MVAPSIAQGGVWLSGGLPPGTLRDMVAVTGCKPAPDRTLVGLVRYRLDGRANRVSVVDRGLPLACAQIAGPALGLALAETGASGRPQPDEPVMAMMPLAELGPECGEADAPAAGQRVDSDPSAPPGRIREPRKIKNVNPSYPGDARSAGVQGMVLLEAVISPGGCISSLRVLRGVSPSLDAAAMAAVSQWRYTPTLLEGKAVPVLMTITVNFRLS
jgi:TonB family protein